MAKQRPVVKGGPGVEQALLLNAMAKARMMVGKDHKARFGQLEVSRAARGARVVLGEATLMATRQRQ
jgi:hypothetical protein